MTSSHGADRAASARRPRHAGRSQRVGLVALTLASLAAALGTRIPGLSVAAHFQVQLLAAWAAVLVLLLVPRVRAAFWRPGRVALLATALLAWHGAEVGALVLPVERPTLLAPSPPLDVVWFNMEHDDEALAALCRDLAADPPDLLALGEANPDSLPTGLATLSHVARIPQDGIAVFSSFPLEDPTWIATDDGGRALLSLRLRTPHASLPLVVAHFRQPQYLAHYREVARLAEYAATRPRLLVLGDLNTTPWSAEMHRLEAAGLTQARRGRGILPSWALDPWHLPPFVLPIDHVLTRGPVVVESLSLLPWSGSDHRPLRARVRFDRAGTRPL